MRPVLMLVCIATSGIAALSFHPIDQDDHAKVAGETIEKVSMILQIKLRWCS